MNADSEAFYEFGIRHELLPVAPASAAAPDGAAAAPAAAAPSSLPFQVCDACVCVLTVQLQVRFTRLDGMECLRVITKLQPVTSDARAAKKVQSLCGIHFHGCLTS